MDAVVEARQPQQPEGADQRQPGAEQQAGPRSGSPPRAEGLEVAHSITSPRIRNFASATVATKPSMAMIERRLEEEDAAGADAEGHEAAACVRRRARRAPAPGPAPAARGSCGSVASPMASGQRQLGEGDGERSGWWRSFEDLQQQALVAALDQVDPVVLVDEIEDVQQQPSARGRRSSIQAVPGVAVTMTARMASAGRVAQLERDLDEARMPAPVPAAGRGSAAPPRRSSGRCRRARSPISRGTRSQRRMRGFAGCSADIDLPGDERDRGAEQEMAEREAVEQQPHQHQRRPSAADRAGCRLIAPAAASRVRLGHPRRARARPRRRPAAGAAPPRSPPCSASPGRALTVIADGHGEEGDDRRDLDRAAPSAPPPRTAPRRSGCRSRTSAISAARPERMTSAVNPSESGTTGGSPAAEPAGVQHAREQGELADEARERRQPGEQERAGGEAEAEDRDRRRAARAPARGSSSSSSSSPKP